MLFIIALICSSMFALTTVRWACPDFLVITRLNPGDSSVTAKMFCFMTAVQAMTNTASVAALQANVSFFTTGSCSGGYRARNRNLRSKSGFRN